MKRFALVGAGGRAISFLEPLATRFARDAELVLMCDVNATRLEHYNQKLAGVLGFHRVATCAPEQFAAKLRDQRVDVVLVTSVDATHHHYIVQALEAGCEVVTEKPMTTDADKCRQILAAVARTGGRVRVAFNYRWQPSRTKVKELIADGAIGAVKSVTMDYLLNTSHGADYFRRWHADMAASGGLLVH